MTVDDLRSPPQDGGRSEPALHGEDDASPAGESFEATISVGSAVRLSRPPVEDAPRSIAGYRVIRVLGHGGMGVVYEAEQPSPRRRVAVKVMRVGHQVDEVHARMFQREAETLGRLRHPGIAAILESGHTSDGRDFFAMELVEGPTLDEWLRKRTAPLDPAELELRLRLFQALCHPVHYAHQRGVIHRDLKPTNIIVSGHQPDEGDATRPPVPGIKVLDFGLARITDPELKAATMMSEIGVIKGTLPYMSPEQARGSVDAIDVRTDVYALGVILYEMISGRRPYEVHQSSVIDALRVICEEPPRSIRQGWRGTEKLDPDLETIVGKALAKEPDQRYGTVAALAEDVERYLASQPISARPPSAAYRAKKFIHRHRAGVAASLLVAAVLVFGIVGTTTGLIRAKRAEAEARVEAATSRRVSQFLSDLLGSVDPERVGALLVADLERRAVEAAAARGTAEDVAEEAKAGLRAALRGVSSTDLGRSLVDAAILSVAGDAIDSRFGEEPEVGARLEHTLGVAYERLGLYDRALEHAERSVDLREAVLGSSAPETLASHSLVGLVLYRQGRVDEAEELLRRTAETQRRVLGAEHPDTLLSERTLTWAWIDQGRPDEAADLLEDVVERQRRALGSEHRETLSTLNSLAVAYTGQRRYADAEALHSQVLEARSRSLGPTYPDTLKSMTNLAVVSFYQGRLADAEALFRDVVETQEVILGPDHPGTLASANNLAVILERSDRPDEAEAMHRRVLEAKRRVLGPDHPETLSSQHNLAIVMTAQGRLGEAERLHRATLNARRRLLGEANPKTLESRSALAGVAALQGEDDTALRRLAEAVELGFLDGDSLATDADFASLRDDPRFQALVEQARANASASR